MGAAWESRGCLWGLPGGLLGASWGLLGGFLGASGGLLGASQAEGSKCPCGSPMWAPSWSRLGGLFGRRGGLLGCLGALLRCLGAVLGVSWAVLGLYWGDFGGILGALGRSWKPLGPSWSDLREGGSWGALYASCGMHFRARAVPLKREGVLQEVPHETGKDFRGPVLLRPTGTLEGPFRLKRERVLRVGLSP